MTDNQTDLTDVVGLLKEQHSALKQLMPQVIDEGNSDPGATFTQVRHMLAVHEALEQEVVHPHAKPVVGTAEVAEREDEERAAADAIARLERLEVDSDEFRDAYRTLMQDVVDHAEHEEREEFAQINDEFTEDELAQVATAVRLLELPPRDEAVRFVDMLERAKTELMAPHSARSEGV